MAVLDELAAYLDSQGHGTVGTDIFIMFMGDEPDEAMSLYNIHVADDPVETFGEDTIPVVDQLRFQLRTRAARRAVNVAEDASIAAWKELTKIANETIGGRYYHRVMKTSGPFLLEIDRKDRPTFVTNFHAMFTP